MLYANQCIDYTLIKFRIYIEQIIYDRGEHAKLNKDK
jgi:hypothetical protein